MEFKKKPQSSVPVLQRQPQAVQVAQPAPEVQRHALNQRNLQRHTLRPSSIQRQVAAPALKAAQLHSAEVQRLSEEQTSIQRQAAEINLPQSAVDAALQRQQAVPAPVPTKPQSIGDWVTVMRFQAEQSEGRRMGAKEASQFTALQRQVAQTMSRSYLTDRQSAIQRQQDYAGHVVALQRHPVSGQVARAFMLSVPQGERAALQRAVDEVSQQEALQRQQDEQALRLHTLQRQLAELDQQATQPVLERIQQRRGAGNPLPQAIQRHLEQGLNHDLSAVRIHDDQEADKLAKKVNAVAFTTGQDIYFRAGKYNPNSQSGLELLAHEVTHTVQQARGEVGPGVDPSGSHEAQARAMGQLFAKSWQGAPKASKFRKKEAAPRNTAAIAAPIVQRVGVGPLKVGADAKKLAAAETKLSKLQDSLKLDLAQAAADAAGLIDPTPISDAIGAGISILRGDWVGAGLSLVSMIPYIGDAVGKTGKGIKLTAKIKSTREAIKATVEEIARLKGLKPQEIKAATQKAERVAQNRGQQVRRVVTEQGGRKSQQEILARLKDPKISPTERAALLKLQNAKTADAYKTARREVRAAQNLQQTGRRILSPKTAHLPWQKYQKHVTGKGYEESWRSGTRKVEVDARVRGNIIEAKWAGKENGKDWANSPYNPLDKRYNEGKILDQMRRLKELSYRTGGKTVEYRLSNPQAQAHFEKLIRDNFPKEAAKGKIKAVFVSGKGMK